MIDRAHRAQSSGKIIGDGECLTTIPLRGRALARKDEATKAAEAEAARKRRIEINSAGEDVGRIRSLLEPHFDSSTFEIEGDDLLFTIKVRNDRIIKEYIEVWPGWRTGTPSSGLNFKIWRGEHKIVDPVHEDHLTDGRILELAGQYYETVTAYITDERERESRSPRTKQLDAVIATSKAESEQFRKRVPWIVGGHVVGLLLLTFS